MRDRARQSRIWECLALGLLSLAMACEPASAAKDGIPVGLLLPFTSSDSPTAANLERAAMYAVARVNEGGGVRGQRLRLIAGDTHSEVGRSLRVARELVDEGAVVLIGPEKPEVAAELQSFLVESEVAFVSPLIGAASEPSSECVAPWFRLGPSARTLGEALAKEAIETATDAVVVYGSEDYNRTLREAFSRRFATLGGRVQLELELEPDAQSYAVAVRRVLRAAAGSIVLATSPGQGTLFVNELNASTSQKPKWFLSPLLKTDLLVQNVPPAAIEGARGVAPKIYDRSGDFPRAFGARWEGDQALEGAYFYYDAVALTAFAIEKALGEPTQQPSYSALNDALLAASAPPGESAGWNEIELGLARLRDGEDVYYSGLTGPLLFDDCGSRQLGVTAKFVVEGGRIIDD